MSAEGTFNMAFVLDQLKPNQKYFEAICDIPHPSTEEKAVSDYVCSVAEKLGLDYEQDKFGNVIVRKPASKGYEDTPVVMLEGHMDMVCVKTPESTHDFSHDPIEIYVDDKGDIRAKDTTLGADDGYGVAYMLAVMEEDFPHPPLELVFTVQEENGCNGVDALDAGKLKSRRMIGLDVMGETVEYTSCVSCFTSDLMKEVYGHGMMETACPGGLECCSLLPRMEGLDIVMFAPIGENCHTTDEYMNLKSFDRVYDFLKTLLGRLK